MNSLRGKLTFSYGLLIIIILAVSAWSIYHFASLGRAIDIILVNNYKSIIAAANMKEALDRQDSAALFFIAGHSKNAREHFEANSQKFAHEFEIAANNITEPGEAEIVADINAKYQTYRKDLESLLARSQPGELSSFYFHRLDPEFLALKDKLDDLLQLNQQAMLAANDRAVSVSRRGEISTAIMAAIGLTVALLFAWRFSQSVAQPISVLAEKAKRIGGGDFDQHISISSRDEIGVLATEFNRMLVRLRDLRKSDYGRLLIEQKKSDAVIDSICEPVIVTDARGHLIKVNRAARQLLGDSTNGDRGDSDLSLSDLKGGERILSAVRDIVSMQRPVAAEDDAAIVPFKLGGAERDFRLRATPMRDSEGRLIGAVTLLEDITAITEVDKLKTEFISIASSKLREPLRALQLALHAVAEGYTGELNEQQNELLEGARANADKLDELIGDLLQLAEIESGARRLSLERLRPIELARGAVERFRPVAESEGIKLENKVWPDLSWVMGDRPAIATIFDNLVSNAIRHTARGGSITVEAAEHVGRVYFSVRDTGDGIAEQYLPTIFSRFVRVGDQAEGKGLGLALVKRLVEAQGGQVSVQSRLGEGSTFTFALITGGPASVRHTA
ncbi:MAG TPA: ATP-binding protein [Blastocatellia bacterium]|nr:ATP-binding protein [Blastocatellia bacterium]